MRPENKQQLVDILKYHVVAGRVYSPDALAAENADTLQGTSVAIVPTESGASVNNARLLTTDLDASNGVIHVIDRVLIPSGKKIDAKKMIFDECYQDEDVLTVDACSDKFSSYPFSAYPHELTK